MPKSKPFKPVKMWAVVDVRGRMVEANGFPLLFETRKWTHQNVVPSCGERVVRVEIREVTP